MPAVHELGILYHVAEKVLKVVEDNHLTEVEAIVLQVGELSGVVPRYLQACYPAAVDGTILEKAKLEIEVLPAHAICHRCGKVLDLADDESSSAGLGDDQHGLVEGQYCPVRLFDNPYSLVDNVGACPDCKEADCEIISGREFNLKEIRAR